MPSSSTFVSPHSTDSLRQSKNRSPSLNPSLLVSAQPLANNPVATSSKPTRFAPSHGSSNSIAAGKGSKLTIVNQDDHKSRHSLAAFTREKTNSVWTNLAVKTRSSTNSLRSRTRPAHVKQESSITSGSASKRSKNVGVSSQSSQETNASSASLLFGDVQSTEHQQPDTFVPAVVVERSSIDRRESSGRASVDIKSLLDQSSSPNPETGYNNGKMHQTSSRLLRMTDEERPFTRDFKDLFSTLIVSLPLSSHRVRFQKVDHTFTSEEAINNLGSLKFSQSNRMPDPKDPTRIVTTTTTTTFSMAKEMARSVCQRFMDARFIEMADGRPTNTFALKGAVWQLTPKGMFVLHRFCQRNGINQRHVLDLLDSSRNTMQLVILERDPQTDKLSHDRATVEVLFRRFVGQEGPNIKSTFSTSDADSVNEFYNGLIGVKMAKERKILDRIVENTFTGKAAVDWLMDCCTTVDRREAFEVAEAFVQHNLIWAVIEDKVFVHQNPVAAKFQPTRNAIYGVTDKGQRIAGWISRESSPEHEKTEKVPVPATNSYRSDGRHLRDSNNNRLMAIVSNSALRLLFREYLRDTHCEENLAFYLEVREFTRHYDMSERAKMFTRFDAIRESLAAAYGKR